MIDKKELTQRLLRGDLARLAEIRTQARAGLRLNPPQHLHAALAAGHAYRAAHKKIPGGRDAFAERALEAIDLTHSKPTVFNISKYTLAKDITAITREVQEHYAPTEKHPGRGPHKGLAPYLAIIRVAAEIEGEDVDAAQIGFLRELTLWHNAPRTETAEESWEAIEALSGLIELLSRRIAKDTGLAEALLRHEQLERRWNYMNLQFEGHFRSGWHRNNRSPVYPVVEFGVNIDETRPFPSVPLVRIPVGWDDVEVDIETGDACAAQEPGTERPHGRWKARSARLIQFREVRLALAPVDTRNIGPVLMSRGAVGLKLEGEGSPTSMVWGTMHWLDTLMMDQEVYADGGWRRIRLSTHCEELTHTANNEGGDWDWEYDPIEHPSMFTGLGADYVSFTRMTPDHLYHWLVAEEGLDGLSQVCPWTACEYRNAVLERPLPLARLETTDGWSDLHRGVDIEGLICPIDTPARHIEVSLYNGRFEETLRSAAQRVVSETNRVTSTQRQASAAAQERLRLRWTQDSRIDK